jgi:hypothetical protein
MAFELNTQTCLSHGKVHLVAPEVGRVVPLRNVGGKE